jgi:hypothetical protein
MTIYSSHTTRVAKEIKLYDCVNIHVSKAKNTQNVTKGNTRGD